MADIDEAVHISVEFLTTYHLLCHHINLKVKEGTTIILLEISIANPMQWHKIMSSDITIITGNTIGENVLISWIPIIPTSTFSIQVTSILTQLRFAMSLNKA